MSVSKKLTQRLRRRTARLIGRNDPHQSEDWQKNWADDERSANFHWRLDEAPPQLHTFLAAAATSGVAVDLGCGDGKATHVLAEHYGFALGVDIASEAVRLGDQFADAAAGFVVGDVRTLPLRSASIDFVYDRGCLHLFKESGSRHYLEEIQRILRPGATALFIEKTSALNRTLKLFSPRLSAQSRQDFVFESKTGQINMTSMVFTTV